MKSLLGLTLIASVAGVTWAQPPSPASQEREQVFIEPPPPPPMLQDGQPIEPEVQIRETPQGRVEEFSHNGAVYMVKVTPEFGPPYYFVDYDRDGSFAPYRSGGVQVQGTQQWMIHSW